MNNILEANFLPPENMFFLFAFEDIHWSFEESSSTSSPKNKSFLMVSLTVFLLSFVFLNHSTYPQEWGVKHLPSLEQTNDEDLVQQDEQC